MASLGAQLHAMNLSFGIYSSGSQCCDQNVRLGLEAEDARQFARIVSAESVPSLAKPPGGLDEADGEPTEGAAAPGADDELDESQWEEQLLTLYNADRQAKGLPQLQANASASRPTTPVEASSRYGEQEQSGRCVTH